LPSSSIFIIRIAEQERAVDPDRPFGKLEAFRNLLDSRFRLNDRIESRIDPIELGRHEPARRARFAGIKKQPGGSDPDVIRGRVRRWAVGAENRELNALSRPRAPGDHDAVRSIPAGHQRSA
jgi:hypothetical protein